MNIDPGAVFTKYLKSRVFSHSACQLYGDLHRDSHLNITTKLAFVLQIQEITATESKSVCWQVFSNKYIYNRLSVLEDIVLWTRVSFLTIANSRPGAPHEQRCCYCGIEMTSQLLPLTLSERTSHRPRNVAIWDLRHDLRCDLTESRWFSFVNTTWLGPGPNLMWDSVRVQAKSWVKSQVKTVSEDGPWNRMFRDHLVNIVAAAAPLNFTRHAIRNTVLTLSDKRVLVASAKKHV